MHFPLFRRNSHSHSQSQPRLTRQHNFGYLTNEDVAGRRTSVSSGQPWLRAHPDLHSLPAPSPAPELGEKLRRQESGSLSSRGSSGRCCPLPSPREGGSQNFSNGDGTAGSNFRLAVPAKSAPASSFSSPRMSPRRLSTGDCFSTGLMVQHGTPMCSYLDLPSVDNPYSSQTSPERFLASSEHSPLQTPTPRSPSPKFCTQTGATSPCHPKLSLDCNALWPEVNRSFSVHPLPRPPVAAVSIPSPGSHQAWKSEVSSMSSQWQKGRLIGSGTFGKVYAATHRLTGASCAMKEVALIPDDTKSAECIRQLEQEIKVLSQLKHQNIVQYYGSEIIEDYFYIYLEFVHPGSISKYIHNNGGELTESVVRNFTRHILCGLEFLHRTKTIHRDIKGGNLLVNADGVVKLADFGMAKHLSGQAAELSLKGSPYWMAPEVMQAVMQKDSEYGLAVDIWSLGCTVIEMFTGKAPWMELEWAAAMFKVLRNETPPIPEALSAEGKDFVRLCLQRDPAHRPSASALLEHPFVNNSNHQELPSCVQGFLQTKPMDVQSPRCMASLMQMCPGTRGNKSKEQLNGDTSQSYSESSKRSAGASRHSPRSTLDALSGLSPPRSNDKIWHSSAPESLPNKKQFGTRNGHPIPLPSSVREAASLSRHNLIEVPSEKFKLMASSNPRGAQSLAYR